MNLKFEPKEILIEKINKIIFLNSKVKNIIKESLKIYDNKYYEEKFHFLKQNLENIKNTKGENTKLKIKSFYKTEKSKSQQIIYNKNLILKDNQNNNICKNNHDSFSLLRLKYDKSFNKSSFVKYSFNFIRYLYDLPLALNLKDKCSKNPQIDFKYNPENFNKLNINKINFKNYFKNYNKFKLEKDIEKYHFKNKQLEEETNKYFEKKNHGFFIFVDKIFQTKYNSKNEICLKHKNFLNTPTEGEIIKSSSQESLKKNSCKNTKKTNQKIIKKSLENILFKEFTETNKEFSRYFLTKNLQKFELRCEKAMIIQSNLRRYLGYKNYLIKIKDYLKLKFIFSITKIQASFRSFFYRKNFKISLIIEYIIKTRAKSRNKIISVFLKFMNKKKIFFNFLLNEIIKLRGIYSITIQKHTRRYLTRKGAREFIYKENNFFKITYPFKANKVQLILYIPREINHSKGSFEIISDEKIYDFTYNKFRDMLVIYLDPKIIKPGKYRALLLVDGSTTCDGRYPHVEFSDGYYYNIIDIYENKKGKNNKNKFKINSEKEEILETRNIYENLSYFSNRNSNFTNNSYLTNEGQIKNSFKSFSNCVNDDYYLNQINLNYKVLKKNLISSDINKKAVCYMDLIRETIKDDFVN